MAVRRSDLSPLSRIWKRLEQGPDKYVMSVAGFCWLWTGGLTGAGYGQISVDGSKVYVHRLVYSEMIGPIPDGLVIDHRCEVRNCCNPGHLEAVSRWENTLRGRSPMAAKAKQVKCHRGHLFDEANTYRSARGTRRCRRCHADGERRRRSGVN